MDYQKDKKILMVRNSHQNMTLMEKFSFQIYKNSMNIYLELSWLVLINVIIIHRYLIFSISCQWTFFPNKMLKIFTTEIKWSCDIITFLSWKCNKILQLKIFAECWIWIKFCLGKKTFRILFIELSPWIVFLLNDYNDNI